MKLNSNIEITLEDNMALMARYPDNYFDLAVVDPVYGHDKIQGGYTSGKGGGLASQRDYNQSLWTNEKSGRIYFEELIRVSKNQVIWGGNYFTDRLPVSMGWIFWDKMNGEVSFSDGEFAWTSFQSKARRFAFRWSGMLQGDMKNKEVRIHPTQKPVKLYEWIFKNYANKGDKILDTHLGSGSIAIALHNMNTIEGMNLSLTGCELDKEYYEDAIERIKGHINQKTIFESFPETNYEQKNIFE